MKLPEVSSFFQKKPKFSETVTDPSLSLFYALLFVLLFPLGATLSLKAPFIKMSNEKRQKANCIAFSSGAALGTFFMILILAGAIKF